MDKKRKKRILQKLEKIVTTDILKRFNHPEYWMEPDEIRECLDDYISDKDWTEVFDELYKKYNY